MQVGGAVITEQGITFAVVVVKRHVIQSSHAASEAIASFRGLFPGMPVVLMAQDSRDVPTYYGRNDIVRFLASMPMEAIPWQRYTVH